jgi:hypothetical protein
MTMKTLRIITATAIATILGIGTALANKVTQYYDGAQQIRTILDSNLIAQAVGNQFIESMDYKGMRDDMARLWKIETETCTIRVALIASTPKDGTQLGIVYTVEEPVKTCN